MQVDDDADPRNPELRLSSFMRILRILVCLIGGTALVTILGWGALRLWPRRIDLMTQSLPPVRFEGNRTIVPLPAKVLLAEVERFQDELPAYLWFDYLRGRPGIDPYEVLLSATESPTTPVYRIELALPNDAMTAIPFLAGLKAKGLIEGFEFVFTVPAQLEYRREQTELFVAAYKRPVDRRLETMPRKQLTSSTAHFLAFKSRTDPRVRRLAEAGPTRLKHEQASEMAADIVAVADFYQLPLDTFLGIGAMENNYLSIRGDLNHAIWKKRAAKDDIVLKRAHNRVLVSNYSIGVWQITRETLRYAHALYLNDKRDYSRLPDRLRPPKVLEFDLTDAHVLTTYAGLILRDLLDRFNGDIEKAVGAYNGGPRNPNAQYAAGVQMVGQYARNILEHVVAIGEEAAADDLDRALARAPE